MRFLGSALLVLSANIFIAGQASAERLCFEQGGVRRDATLMPFCIEVGPQLTQSTREVVFVDPLVFEHIVAVVKQSGLKFDQEKSPNGFGVTRYQGGRSIATYKISNDDMKSVLRVVEFYVSEKYA